MMLMIPNGYENAAPGTMPNPKAVAAMTENNEGLQAADVLLSCDGLHPPSRGARVSFKAVKKISCLWTIRRIERSHERLLNDTGGI
jgi:hypothetical protein